MMGSGKTTIGKQVAKLLNYSFIDTDSLIEEKMKMSIEEIFFKHGENYFRKIEQEIVNELEQTWQTGRRKSQINNRPCLPQMVIATGGGIILSEINRSKLVDLGIVIYLNSTSSCLIKNLEFAKNDRPLLRNVEKKEKIEQLIEERRSLYEIADYEIIVENKSVLEISKNIIEICSKSKNYGKM
ncbi:MAG: shikimate kinase [Alkaliphilus sp.]|nr:MAG: shikimate kinase [Alkaliphilus sp.]